MYIQEITIDIKSRVNRDVLMDELSLLMAFYRGNGQSQGNIESQYITDNKAFILPFTLEKNALDIKFNNFYVEKQLKKIEKLCDASVQIRTIGKSYATYSSPCKCKKSNFYILITNYLTLQSPVTCGTCNGTVPLYRLPEYNDHGYMDILRWETNYKSCDSLQMNCEVGERWALNQMQNSESSLSKQGMEICQKVEGITLIPTFYYLYNYTKKRKLELNLICPKCKSNWVLQERLHEFFDFKCDRCKLISTVSMKS